MDDILDSLESLLKQATTERSHHYVASCARDAIAHVALLREENRMLTDVLNQARETLLISITAPAKLQASLAKLNLACLAHWNWQTEVQKPADPGHGR